MYRELRCQPATAQLRAFSSGRKWLASQYIQFGQPRRHWDNNPSGKGGATRKGDSKLKVIIGGAFLAGVYYVFHLERTPESGRLRFMDVTSKMEEDAAAENTDLLVRQYQNQILSPDHPLTVYVTTIVSSILEASNLGHVSPASLPSFSSSSPDAADERSNSTELTSKSGPEWNVLLIDDPTTVNAYAIPGNIIIFTGLLPICSTPSGKPSPSSLAGVIGHEVAHVTLRHMSEKLSLTRAITALETFVGWLGIDVGLGRVVSWLTMNLPNSRKQEMEADALGMKYAARACFDPGEMPGIFTRLAALEGEQKGLNFAILRTHPTGEARSQALSKLLPAAYDTRSMSDKCEGLADTFQAFRMRQADLGGARTTRIFGMI